MSLRDSDFLIGGLLAWIRHNRKVSRRSALLMAYFNKRNDLMKWKVQRTVRGESLYVDTKTELYRKIYVTVWDFFSIAAPRESTSRLG